MRPELDRMPPAEVVALLLDAEDRILPAVRAVADRIGAGAQLLADSLDAGGRLVFVGAGTSGRIAAAEAAELPGSFGLARDRVVARIAGGAGGTDDDEDDVAAAARDLDELDLTAADVVIAVAASGATPYTLVLAEGAAARGAAVIAVVTVAGSPLAALARLVIAPEVGGEVVRGSTRLGAGTAQKICLNTLTTAAMARYGRVHGDLMVDVVPANAKLRERAAGIVADITGSPLAQARRAVERCAGDTRAAVLHLSLDVPVAEARSRAREHRTLRDALVAE